MDHTFIMIKPDGVKVKLIGEIIRRFERRGFQISALEMKVLPRETAELFYDIHAERPFFETLVDFVTSGPVVGVWLKGPQAVEMVRKMIGVTDPSEALPGTIRGDYASRIETNIIHGSDSPENAEREREIFFGPDS
ncbi:MAG: nucleoside-diphosphate kinase [Terriglobia bacterium]